MATRTPARGRFRAQANPGRASSSNPMAASRRSIERSKGLQSRLSAVAWGKSGARREAGDGAAEGRASIGVLRVREAVADIASEPPTCGRNGRERKLGSGPGFQPRRRRILRTAFSLRPSPPAIHRLLLSLALRRRMVPSRWELLLYPKALTGARTSTLVRDA